MTTWNKFFTNHYIEILQGSSIILDIGGGQVFAGDTKPYKNKLKKDNHYFSCDIHHTYKPTLVGDAHKLPIKTSSIDAVICKAVLEHVHDPKYVVDEIYRITKKNSKVLIYTPFLAAYHGNNEYLDYYRFTHDGLKYLFRKWKNVELQYVRGYLETVVCLFPPFIRPLFQPIASLIDKGYKTPQVSGYFLYAEK